MNDRIFTFWVNQNVNLLKPNVAPLLTVYSIRYKTSITELAVHFYFARATVLHMEALFVAGVCCCMLCLALLLALRFCSG